MVMCIPLYYIYTVGTFILYITNQDELNNQDPLPWVLCRIGFGFALVGVVLDRAFLKR